MLLTWNNTKSFKQHLAEMKSFRQTHTSPKEMARMFKNMPVMYKVNPLPEQDFYDSLTNDQEKLRSIPIWDITLAEGAQN
jgi:hypothetical protein